MAPTISRPVARADMNPMARPGTVIIMVMNVQNSESGLNHAMMPPRMIMARPAGSGNLMQPDCLLSSLIFKSSPCQRPPAVAPAHGRRLGDQLECSRTKCVRQEFRCPCSSKQAQFFLLHFLMKQNIRSNDVLQAVMTF
jgi:hypothetical protein